MQLDIRLSFHAPFGRSRKWRIEMPVWYDILFDGLSGSGISVDIESSAILIEELIQQEIQKAYRAIDYLDGF